MPKLKPKQTEWNKRLVKWIIANPGLARSREAAMASYTRYEQEMLYRLEEDRGAVLVGFERNKPKWAKLEI